MLMMLIAMTFVFLSFAEMMHIQLVNGETLSFSTEEIQQITFSLDTSVEEVLTFLSKVPIQFLKNYPNPFNPTTTIAFEVTEGGLAKVEIFNVKGQKVKTLLNEKIAQGNHSLFWNGKNEDHKQVSSGVYFYKISINGAEKINKMLMLK